MSGRPGPVWRRRRSRRYTPPEAPPPAPPDPEPEPTEPAAPLPPAARDEQGWLGQHAAEIGIGLAGVVLGTALVWIVAPGQEVRSQRAVQSDQRQRDGRGAPLGYEANYQYFVDDQAAYVFPVSLPTTVDPVIGSRRWRDHIGSILTRYDGMEIVYPDTYTEGSRQMMTRTRLVLEGRRTDPVLIESIAARIVKRRPPLAGTLLEVGAQGGAGDVVHLGFDLDSPDLNARSMRGRVLGERYDKTKFVALAKAEPLVVTISAFTATCYCEWVIDVATRSAGRKERMTIDDRGKPFRSTALAHRYSREFQYVLTGGYLRGVTPQIRGTS
jgi:hypothetical protein